MGKRATDIVAYITWAGLLIALLAGDRECSRFHLNQALVIALFSLLGVIPCVGWIWAVFVAVCWGIGFFSAVSGTERPIPLLGKIRIL